MLKVKAIVKQVGAFALYTVNPGPISGIPYDPPSTTRSNYWAQKPGIIPEHWQAWPKT